MKYFFILDIRQKQLTSQREEKDQDVEKDLHQDAFIFRVIKTPCWRSLGVNTGLRGCGLPEPAPLLGLVLGLPPNPDLGDPPRGDPRGEPPVLGDLPCV